MHTILLAVGPVANVGVTGNGIVLCFCFCFCCVVFLSCFLFCLVLCCPSCRVLSCCCPVLSCFALCCLVLYSLVLSCLSRFVLSCCVVLSCLVLYCLVMAWFVLSYSCAVLSCLVLCCVVLSCHGLDWLGLVCPVLSLSLHFVHIVVLSLYLLSLLPFRSKQERMVHLACRVSSCVCRVVLGLVVSCCVASCFFWYLCLHMQSPFDLIQTCFLFLVCRVFD
jgi:hypothetical protein